ncbi:glycerol-3-phosphate O-acyltransferase [Punctularia strigosozonata HHB-11173 SS5]|uniref:glycerol-3-phosphate O-acyltransferase n=1 Tax=Punctularia strigosozonata (strain HHB-11173) TaxID=741275 RepID=UPI00044164AB|nr:glycerol-3-phosphate O-acyltransferase [Punctularia strigosozonata HHB-11173 SS5]EIN07408.1 glycerol-3-phosphate O-acyltransferase [Punctularia strigosozonata HHB-11173 SS5]
MSDASHKTSIAYDASLVLWQAIVNIFFREIRPRGAYNIPRIGPVIFVGAPHSNQFLDPLLLMLEVHRETRRHVQFLIAAKSMQRRAIGFFAGLVSSIPVRRAVDEAKPGKGTIQLSPDDACLVLGQDTEFAKQLAPKMQILLPRTVGSSVAEVVEVISDTKVRIKREFGGDSGKGTARIREKQSELLQSGEKGFTYKTLPFINQKDMYQHVYQTCKEGGSIGIFPEGGSHDRTDLLPLKAGVSVMALGAMADDPNVKVKIVPVGLSYFHPHKFRSRAVVEFGTAMDVPSELVELFKQGGAQKRDAVAKLMDLVYDGLKTVTIRAPDYDTLMVIQAARRLYRTPGQHLTLGQVVELNKRFLEGYNHFKDEPRIQQLRTDVLKYNRLVRDLGLRDHQVPLAQRATWKTLGLLLYRIGLLLVWSVFALPGVILNGPIFITAKIMSAKKAKEALAASTVKIAGRDVVATWKILISLGLAPLLYTFYSILAVVIAARFGAPLKWRIAAPLLFIFASPFIGYAALKFGEAGMDVFKSLRPLILALLPGHQKQLNKLKEMRAQLSNELADVINTFGPKLYPDFDQARILIPSAKPPPSTPRDSRGQSIAAGHDGNDSILAHPMTWLDEKLFGWSTSSKRGTSAWAGGSKSHDASTLATPDDSDDEDAGDYDNVLGYLPSQDLRVPPSQKSRSRNGSYADLQKLRLTKPDEDMPSSSTTTATEARTAVGDEGEGSSPTERLRYRGAHRDRRGSLTDLIAVERIGTVDREESFKEATEELNAEISKNRAAHDSKA